MVDHSPQSLVLGFPLQLFPCQPALLDVPASGVWSALGVLSKGLAGGAGFRFSECEADPSTSCFLDLLFHRLLGCSLSEIILADGIWPVDIQEDPPQAAVTLVIVVLFALHVSDPWSSIDQRV